MLKLTLFELLMCHSLENRRICCKRRQAKVEWKGSKWSI